MTDGCHLLSLQLQPLLSNPFECESKTSVERTDRTIDNILSMTELALYVHVSKNHYVDLEEEIEAAITAAFS